MRTVKVYSVSTTEGDSLIDSEDYDGLMAGIHAGVGTHYAIMVGALILEGSVDKASAWLQSNYGVTLTVEDYER